MTDELELIVSEIRIWAALILANVVSNRWVAGFWMVAVVVFIFYYYLHLNLIKRKAKLNPTP